MDKILTNALPGIVLWFIVITIPMLFYYGLIVFRKIRKGYQDQRVKKQTNTIFPGNVKKEDLEQIPSEISPNIDCPEVNSNEASSKAYVDNESIQISPPQSSKLNHPSTVNSSPQVSPLQDSINRIFAKLMSSKFRPITILGIVFIVSIAFISWILFLDATSSLDAPFVLTAIYLVTWL